MIGMSKLTHRIEKKAVEILVDRIMAERNPADRQKKLKRLSYVMQHLFGDLFEKESFDDARRLIAQGNCMNAIVVDCKTGCRNNGSLSIS